MMDDERIQASRRMVCLGFDCMRVALGMDPVTFDLEQIRTMISQRIDDRYSPASASPDHAGKRSDP